MIPEITSDSPEVLHRAWPNVTYKGVNFFDSFYVALERITSSVFVCSDFQDHQEVFVGYLPVTDEFLVGWDAWHHERDEDDMGYFGYKLQSFKFDGERLIMTDVKMSYDEGGFYPKGLKAVHERFPKLIDLRLD